MDIMKATVEEIFRKSKEFIRAMMESAVKAFAGSKKSVATDANNVLTALDKTEDKNENRSVN